MQENIKNKRKWSGGCKSKLGVQKVETKKARNKKAQDSIFVPVLGSFPARVFSNLQLSHTCTKAKTHNTKHVA